VQLNSHLRRLSVVWIDQPVYFITTCTIGRRPILANAAAHEILRKELYDLKDRYGWAIGRYTVMPDHVHFFAASFDNGPGASKSLPTVIGKWKEWTAKRLTTTAGITGPIWQREFFDHLLRSEESRSEKWEYIRKNPERLNLVANADDWPYSGWIHFE